MQPKIEDTRSTEAFWNERYQEQKTGWDIGYPSTPIKEYVDQLSNHQLRILIPGAGNAYEAEYLYQNGFHNTYVLDISSIPLAQMRSRFPDFPKENLIQANFFEHSGTYDLILEQTFFCSFPPHPDNRHAYAKKVWSLLEPEGILAGLWFSFPLREGQDSPPYGGSKEEYLQYLDPHFEVIQFAEAKNSIPPRLGNELFGILKRKATHG